MAKTMGPAFRGADQPGVPSARRSLSAILAVAFAAVFLVAGTGCGTSGSSPIQGPGDTGSEATPPIQGPGDTGPEGKSPSPPPRYTPPPPVITGISPAHGPPGETVTIRGSGFVRPVKVVFGVARALNISVRSSNLITVISPPGTGTVYVHVVTLGGLSADSAVSLFTYRHSAALGPLPGKPAPSPPETAGASSGMQA